MFEYDGLADESRYAHAKEALHQELVLAVAGVLASAAAERPSERVHVQQALEARGILADSVDVHLAVEKLRRRHGWVVWAVEGLPGYRLEAWPHRFTRARR